MIGIGQNDMGSLDHVTFFIPLQWTISELACHTYSLVAVPLYDTLGTEAIDYILEKGRSAEGPRPI